MSALRRVASLAGLTAAAALPGVVLANVVPGGRAVIVTGAAALAGTVVAALVGFVAVRRGRGAAAVAAALGVLALAAALVGVAAWQPDPSAARGALAATGDALARGWATIATSPVPADAAPRTLVPLALVAALAAAGAVALAARRGRAATALLPGATALVAASVAAGRAAYAPTACGLSFLTAAALHLRATGAGSRPGRLGRGTRSAGPRLRRAAPVAALLAVVGASAAVVGPRLTFGRTDQTFDPREHVAVPAVASDATNPLDLATSRRRRGDEPMFTVTSDTPVVTRLVALEAFDGVRWTTDAEYRPTGSVVDMTRRTDIGLARVRATIAVDGLTGPWLPSFGDPLRVTGTPVLVDAASGSFVVRDGDADGRRYTIDAEVPAADPAAADALGLANDERTALALPDGVPPVLAEMAEVATRGAATPLARAVLLERYLRLSFTVDDEAATGQSYGHLVKALTSERAGSEEQFALAFAVLGRLAGLPTRVVVGFGPGASGADRTWTVRSGDARVWPEVKFDGAGWLPFDPVPAHGQDDERSSDLQGGRVAATLPAEPESARPVDGGSVPIVEAVPTTVPAADDGGASTPLVVLVAVLAALVLVTVVGAAVTVVVKRRRTHRRRHAADARDRVIGAWHDVLERSVELGVNATDARTVEEVVASMEPLTTSLAGLYRPVSRALYDDAPLDAADAAQAWRARDRFVSAARRSLGARRRLVALVDPRPLLRRIAEPVPRVGGDERVAEPVLVGSKEAE